MDTALSVVSGLVSLLLLTIFVVIYLRLVVRPHSKKMAREQAELDRKTGTASGTSATATATNGGGRLERLTPYRTSILLALTGAAVFYWGLYTPGLRLSQVGDWSWDRWLWLLVFWGIITTLIALNAKALGTMAKTLQTTAMVAMFLLFLGIPAGFWVRDLFLPTIICPDVSAHQTRSCNINTAWSTWIKAAEGPAVDGMQICATPGGQFERTDANGTTFYRFKTDEGRLVKAYRLFPANTACPATLP
jgi:hypothetical protein